MIHKSTYCIGLCLWGFLQTYGVNGLILKPCTHTSHGKGLGWSAYPRKTKPSTFNHLPKQHLRTKSWKEKCRNIKAHCQNEISFGHETIDLVVFNKNKTKHTQPLTKGAPENKYEKKIEEIKRSLPKQHQFWTYDRLNNTYKRHGHMNQKGSVQWKEKGYYVNQWKHTNYIHKKETNLFKLCIA